MTRRTPSRVTRIGPALLRARPLPRHASDGDKEERGRLLVVAAAADVPGAAILAGIAGLRAGAGKLCMAVAPSAVTAIGTLVPECRALACTPRAMAALLRDRYDTVLAGPGMPPSAATSALVRRILRTHDGTLVLDAGAMGALRTARQRDATPRCIVTPHAGEMAKLMDLDRDEVLAHPVEVAREAAARLGAIVVLKGATTIVADPDGDAFRHDGGTLALATSGSGDTLAGIIAGLAARGAAPTDAAIHGVSLHAQAGQRAARRTGRLGALAREFSGEIPALLARS